MSLYEYDQERHIRMEREDAREDGRAEERINTERERQRADSAEQRANAAEAELEKLRRQLALFTR